jgi:predicted RNA-binding protein YlqC (UPF0109 family)
VDHPLPADGAATIIRARPSEGVGGAAPAPRDREERGDRRDRGDRGDRFERRERRPPRERSEPDAHDQRLRELVTFMANGLVDFPDEVSVEITEAGEDSEFELRVHPDDIGHVIGRQGRTARAMRLCLSAAAARLGRRAGLEIAD